MSIPKEPRQLMINIMYLVLTALLALNVSAEVFNAFKLVDKGLVKSNKSLDEANAALPQAIRDGAKKRESLATYAERVDPILQKSDEMSEYLQNIVDGMIEETGGYLEDRENPGVLTDELKAAKDYDITTRTLVTKSDGTPGIGEEVKAKLEMYRDEIMSLIDEEDQAAFSQNVSVQIDNETWQKKKKKSWSHMNFDHMPLQAVIPIFTKYINDIKSTEAAALNYLANKVGTTADLTFDKYTVVSAPERSYVIKGEQYKADLFLTAAAGGDSKTGITIAVNGRNLSLDDEGKAQFVETASSIGPRRYTATATLTNPVTGETESFKKEFEYEVGERSVTVSATKMNVFYIGVDNPVEVSAAGVPSNQINVSMSGAGEGAIKADPNGGFVVNVKRPTKLGEFAKVNVTAPGLQASKDFRVKRIPDPVPKLSQSRGGLMGSGEFKIQPGVFPVLENFDFDARCEIVGFRLVRVPKRQDPQVSDNRGGRYSGETKSIVDRAKPTDTYFYENIKCRCPGDPAPRDIGTMVFKIN